MAAARRNDDGLTDKQRTYVSLRIDGFNPVDAYIRSFKSGPVANERTVAESARRLEKLAKITQAIQSGREARERIVAAAEKKATEAAAAQLAARVVLTRQFVIDELLGNVERAKHLGALNASNRALELLGKELGMFKDAGEPDLFEKLSPQQVRELKRVLDEWGEAERAAQGTLPQ